MVKLTDRLQVLADQIDEGETMADIGTDHGFLPIALWEQGTCPHVILTDISPGSLDKARQTGRSLHPQQEFDLRLGSGIQVLKKGEVDAVVIAGMGGVLMTRILEEDLEKTHSFRKLVLQPRSGQGRLRHWLVHHGCSIAREFLVREGKYLCEILMVFPSGNPCDAVPESQLTVPSGDGSAAALFQGLYGKEPDDIAYEVPPWIFSAGELAEPFVRRKLATEEQIWEGLMKSKRPDYAKEKKTQARIIYLKSLLGGI